MIVIIDSDLSENSFKLRNLLRNKNIPAAVFKSLNRDIMQYVIVINSDTSQSVDISDIQFVNLISCQKCLSDKNYAEKVIEKLLAELNYKMQLFSHPRFYYSNDVPYYLGLPLDLSKAERLILKCISYLHTDWVSADIIVSFCLDSSRSSVPVHINGINRKAKDRSPLTLILSKRFHGYRIKYTK